MGKIIDVDLRSGSLIEKINGEALDGESNGRFERTDKGLAWATEGTAGSSIRSAAIDNPNYSFTNGDFTIVWDFFLKQNSYNDSWKGLSFSDATYSTGFIITTNRFVTQTTDINVLSDSYPPPDANKWHQVLITHDLSAKTIITYVNGVEVSLDDYSTVGNGVMKTNYGRIEINEYSTRYFDGKTSRVMVYDHVATEKERAKLYSQFLRASPITKTIR